MNITYTTTDNGEQTTIRIYTKESVRIVETETIGQVDMICQKYRSSRSKTERKELAEQYRITVAKLNQNSKIYHSSIS